MPHPAERTALLRLRILLWHARPFLAGGVALLVGLGVVRALAPPPPPTVEVIVTAHHVPAGIPLSATDLRTARFPPHLVPDDALRADDDALGRRTALDLSAGTVLATALLAGERFAITPPVGAVIVPVRLSASGTAGLLRPGDRIDLVAPADGSGSAGSADLRVPDAVAGTTPGSSSGPSSAHTPGPQPVTLAHGALVLDVDGAGGPDDASGPGSGGLVRSIEEDDPVTVVAVTPAEGRRLASVTVHEALGAVLVP